MAVGFLEKEAGNSEIIWWIESYFDTFDSSFFQKNKNNRSLYDLSK